ncbi:hypothetical protein PVAND_009932 [Polypedilum vanderplanki]|uniref:Uncharacterized protein n=1 Tax=Polypedilum vanderplanki TaxID=319348 RepID=A0A9J6CF39_POLVA|nr:hypothetical protein PVAND_009932 [Polypedilum vanderplanki]
MSLTREDSFKFDQEMPEHFIRGIRARKSFRIRQRVNTKLPPAALIYMKSLEKTNVDDIKTSVSSSTPIVQTNLHKTSKKDKRKEMIVQQITEIEEFDETFCDESMPLLRRSTIGKKNKNSFKKSFRKHKKLNKIINFFR